MITELAADSAGQLRDGDGDSSDWIELYNASDAPIDLDGWSLTDDPQDLGKWRFPRVQIDPFSYLVVFASGKDRAADGFRLRRDFNATRDGTFLVDLPEGIYDVRIGMGDTERPRDQVALWLQGERREVVATAAGGYFTARYRAEVSAATGGQLALRIEDTGGLTGSGVINRLVITPAAGGDDLRFDFGTPTSPVENGFVGVTADAAYDPDLGYGWQPGAVIRQQDRDLERDELHTNFKLSSRGEFLALVRPDGQTIADQFAPAFPPQPLGVSYGLKQDVVASTPIGPGAEARWMVPTVDNGGDALGRRWTEVAFDDQTWAIGPTGIGFASGTPIDDLVATNISAAMKGKNGSAYLRIPFTVRDPTTVFSMQLKMKYDDGYVAYLNGIEVASSNKPEDLAAGSTATNARIDTKALDFEDVDLTAWRHLLREGANILAVQGLNRRAAGDNVFLILPQLDIRQSVPIADAAPAFFSTPSPGAPNGTSAFDGAFASPPGVSQEGGFFAAPLDVVVQGTRPGATLIVTTDGARPSLDHGTIVPATSANAIPVASLTIARTTVLRAVEVQDGFIPSPVATRTYIFPADVATQSFQSTVDAGFPAKWGVIVPDYGLDPAVVGPHDAFDGEFSSQFTAALTSIPTLSIVMDVDDLFGERGIYTQSHQRGFEWERPATLEWIDPAGGPGFLVDAGIRIYGGFTRQHSVTKKKSFRVAFRKQYGPGKLKFPLFGGDAADRFDTLVLRTNGDDGWQWVGAGTQPQYLRDEWMRATQLAMGQPASHGTFNHVYINGVYWGLYNTVERPDASFSATYSGGKKDEWDNLNVNRAVNGTATKWSELLLASSAVAVDDAAASNAAYQRLLGNFPDGSNDPQTEALLDVDNLIDYMIANIYGGNTDWPDHNYYLGRRRGDESEGFQFYSWDAEWTLLLRNGLSTNRTELEKQGPGAVYMNLKANDEFRLRFADHVQRHFFEGGALYVDPENPAWDPQHPERNRPAARYARLADEIELAMIGESARWGDQHREALGRDLPLTLREWRAERDRLLETYFPRRSGIVLDQLRQAGLFPSIDAPVLSQHGGRIEPGFELGISGAGEIYYTLDGTDPRRSSFGGPAGVSASAIRYRGPIAIDPGAHVKARVLADGQWSALSEATFAAAAPQLRISEIMYHPVPDPDDPARAEDAFEFIEVVNISAATSLNLRNIALAEGIAFTFPEMTLAPGEPIVVVRNLEAFRQRYGTEVRVAGEYEGKLSNSGETLRLEDATGALIQEVTYRDFWYRSTDGEGFSLEVLSVGNSDLDAFDRADAYLPSIVRGGTPSADRASAPVVAGDTNLDGTVDDDDIAAFVFGLTERAAYRARFGIPAALAGDTDGDGDLDYDDIASFAAAVDPRAIGELARQGDRKTGYAAGVDAVLGDPSQ